MNVKSPPIIVGNRFWQWVFDHTKLAAITLPFGRHGRIYVDKSLRFHQGLIRHELVHIEQIARDGRFMFATKYLWWLLIYGYRDNPYEREAYAKEPIEET